MAAEAGFGVVPLEQVRTMDGLTLIKGLMEGRFPAPPISEVLGFDIAEVEVRPGGVHLHAGVRPLQPAGHASMAASPPPCSIR